MAKRKKLEAPSAVELSQFEEEFASGRAAASPLAPIAQVARDAASGAEVLGVETRAKLAQADAYREADEKGLVLREVPLERIRTDEIVRDRAVLDREELNELRASIVKNGLRLPIEIYELAEKTEEHDYVLISGYRRLLAVREAWQGTGLERFSTIKAIVRQPAGSAEAVAAMVEENEVRSDLSHFERGRISAISAQSGVFVNVEEAVSKLFQFSSKAKRSKIRSFALIFEELGDMFDFPEALTERQGLAIAAALRAGAEHELRVVLAEGDCETPQDEWERIAPVLAAYEGTGSDPGRGGRPAAKRAKPEGQMVETPRGVRISWEPLKKGGYALKLTGKVEADEIDGIVATIQERLR